MDASKSTRKAPAQQISQQNNINNNNNDDADDDDYMSDKILSTIEDTRPGLLFSRATARKYELEKKETATNEKSRSKSEVERREEALTKPVESTIGLSLMKKMGFIEGMTLGKPGGALGISEPIAIKLKADRGGLGSETEKKRKASEWAQRKAKLRKDETVVSEEAFVAAKRSEVLVRKLKGCLAKAQRVCRELDASEMIDEPLEDYFWPVESVAPPRDQLEVNKNEKEEAVAQSEARKQRALVDEIIAREDEDDELIDKGEIMEKPMNGEHSQQMLMHRIDSICAYLRRRHLYCVWCAVRFNDALDLASNCPGLTFDAHEEI